VRGNWFCTSGKVLEMVTSVDCEEELLLLSGLPGLSGLCLRLEVRLAVSLAVSLAVRLRADSETETVGFGALMTKR
jgi:hypothetical protein